MYDVVDERIFRCSPKIIK